MPKNDRPIDFSVVGGDNPLKIYVDAVTGDTGISRDGPFTSLAEVQRTAVAMIATGIFSTVVITCERG